MSSIKVYWKFAFLRNLHIEDGTSNDGCRKMACYWHAGRRNVPSGCRATFRTVVAYDDCTDWPPSQENESNGHRVARCNWSRSSDNSKSRSALAQNGARQSHTPCNSAKTDVGRKKSQRQHSERWNNSQSASRTRTTFKEDAQTPQTVTCACGTERAVGDATSSLESAAMEESHLYGRKSVSPVP